jgi:acetyl esterase/lipase
MGLVASLVFLAALALALVAIVPARRPPLSTLSFMVGFVSGELAGQLLALTLVAVAAISAIGWPHGALGEVATALAVASVLAYGALLVLGLCATRVVRRALAAARGLEIAPDARRPGWLRWWRTLLAFPVHGPSVRLHRSLAYDDDGDPAHVLDVLTPSAGTDGAPVMVFVHGGAWTIGSKEQQCLPMLYELASRGWVVVSCDYRLSPRSTWPDHIVDVKRVVAWSKAHAAEYGGDPSRFVAIAGNSAGGHLAALAALTPGTPEWQPGFEAADTSVDACVSIYGVLDMTGDPGTAGPQGRALRSHLGQSVMKVRIDDAPDLYDASSPIHRINGDAPPFLVLHGTKDTLVSVDVARAFVARFLALTSSPIAYVELPFAQHGYDTLCSPRCSAATVGISRFLDALVAARATRPVT